MDKDTIYKVLRMYHDGKSKRSIAIQLKLSRTTVDRVVNFHSYKRRDVKIKKCPDCGGRFYTKVCLVCKIRKYKEEKRGYK